MPAAIRRRIRSRARQSLMNIRAAKSELKTLMNAEGDAIKMEFDDIVSDWSPENRTRFVKRLSVRENEIRVEVRPVKREKASKIFEYVDKGTPPHKIRAKKAKTLAFKAGPYSPKTLPIAQAHVGTGTASGPLVFPQEVNHPGTEARLFSETIENRRTPFFRAAVENLFRRLERKLRS